MLLRGYRKEIFRPECNPQFQSLHCIAHLNADITEVLPYLNTVLGGHQYFREPPSLTFKHHGKLITLHPREIAVNALRDEEEADKILEWLREEINETWEKRTEIRPSFETPARPRILEILKLLPRINCHECGQPTCMVFAAQIAEGGRGADACAPLGEENRQKLSQYLSQFHLDM
jgi:ArsR family metal-binding transcriptional regulator